MRRFSLLLASLALAWFGVSLAGGAEQFAPYLLRDALLLGGLGSLIFALNAGSWLAPPVFRRRRGLQRRGWTFLLTGFAVALAGGLGLAFGPPGILRLSAAIAWVLGILLQLTGAWWRGAAEEYARPLTRWGRDAAGNIVPLPAGGHEENPGESRRLVPQLGVRSWSFWLLALLLLAALLRFWNLEQLPPVCIDAECTTALRLVEGRAGALAPDPGAWALDEQLAALFTRATGSGLLGLRLASALWGWLSVLFTALASRRLAGRFPALLATALLVLSPWHLWAGRSSDPWLATACLSALALWLGLEAIAAGHVRWWAPWGVAMGLLALQTPLLWPGIALWALAGTGLGLLQAQRGAGRVGAAEGWRWPLCGLAAACTAALPIYPAAHDAVQGWMVAGADTGSNAVALLTALLRPEASAAGALTGSGLLSGVGMALVLTGAGVLLRHLRQPAAPFLLAGITASGAAVTQLNPAVIPPATSLLPLLPFLVGLAAVAIDRLLAALLAAWGPPLVRTSILLAGSALLLLLLVGRGAPSLLWELDSVRGSGETAVGADMARYIAAQLHEEGGQDVTFVTPRSVLDHPSLRLLAGGAVAEDRIQALEPGHTLPFAQTPSGDVMYLLPLLDNQVLQLLRQFYPNGTVTTEMDAGGERALFNRFGVTQADLLGAQSLGMILAPGGPGPAAARMEEPLSVAALDFAWSSAPPLALPFTARWSGSLVAPRSGNYTVAVESSAPRSSFTLLLDDILLLDSSLGLQQQSTPLPQGIHRLALEYRSGDMPGDLRVTWQAPGGQVQTLAAPLLHSPMLPDQGLLGDYYGNADFEGAPVAEHKDPVIGLDPGLPLPYSVRWHGMLAAPRAGEYLIGLDAPGPAQVTVNGLLLADNTAGAEEGSTYSEALIYLPVGWHSIEVRYAPDAQRRASGATGDATGGLRLLWQPPGSDPSELGSQYLLPAYVMPGPVDAPLPPPAALSDPQLGDDRFALSRPSAVWQPHLRVPPAGLVPLALERVWAAGGTCGSAADQLSGPHGATFDTDGARLYVADTLNRRIQVFGADGVLIESIESDLFEEPVDVAIDAGGDLLVLDALTQQIYRIDAQRNATALPLRASFYRPRGLAVDIGGNLLVADTGGGRVVLLSPTGEELLQHGGAGSLLGNGQPVAVLPAADALWALSAEDGRLWNLSSGGSLTAVQPTGTVDGPHLAQLSDGRLLASDPSRATFVLFSAAGEPLAQFSYPGELQQPTGIAATSDAAGELIAVVDTRACSVSAWRLVQ